MIETRQYSTDESIVQGIKKGDDLALNHLYTSKFDLIKHFILKNNGDLADAKDIYQDAVIVLYHKILNKDFKLTASLNTYLYSVARNIWLKQLNKRSKISTTNIHDSESYLKLEAEESYDLERAEAHTAKEKATLQALDELGEPCKSLLVNYYFNRQSMQEISETMNYKSAKTAKNQKYKCMKRLQKMVLDAI